MHSRNIVALFASVLFLVAGSMTLAQERPAIGGPFTLTDMNGAEVTQASYPGKYKLVFFGYTHCPAVCPTALLFIGQALDLLGDDGDKVQAIFISVDPSRDTAAVLKDYVANFHPRIVGLSGTEAQVAAAARAYKVYYARVETPDSEAGYLMDHSAAIFFMDPRGRLIEAFRHDTDPEVMAAAIRRHL